MDLFLCQSAARNSNTSGLLNSCILIHSQENQEYNSHVRGFSSKALAKRIRKYAQVEDLGLLATLFGQALCALGLTCDDLRSLWSR